MGRAGRAVPRADVILLPGPEDRDIWAYFASLAFPPEALVRATLGALGEAAGPLSSGALETQVDLSRARLEMMLKVLDVDGAVRKVSGGWVATGQPWSYDAERYATVAAERHREQQAMLDYLRSPRCRMEYLRQQLDDPAARSPAASATTARGSPGPRRCRRKGPRSRRPVCPSRYRHQPAPDVAAGHETPRRGRGRQDPAELSADTGRALGRLTGLGWGRR